MSTSAPASEQQIAAELRLRRARPVVTRLSRKVLIGLGAVSSVTVIGAVAYAMNDCRHRSAKPELYNVGGTPTERLSALPKDYGDAPRPGPPLPGVLPTQEKSR